jgi:hypothetical protein
MSKVHVENLRRGGLNLRYGVCLKAKSVTPVDAEAWDKCKADQYTRHYLDVQEIRVVSVREPVAEGEKPAAVVEKPVDWADLSAKDAIAKVKECSDLEGLEALYDKDDRTTVQEAVSSRVDELSDADDDEDGDEG